MTHRGPDDAGYHLEPGLAMASRRLALVDIAHGHQPMSSADDALWVSVNGELYDDEPLRNELTLLRRQRDAAVTKDRAIRYE